MGILKTKKNKKFGYTPRYYKNDGEGSPFQIEHKFDKFRKTVGNNGLKTNFKNDTDINKINYCFIRPEDVKICNKDKSIMSATVIEISFLGNLYRYLVKIFDEQLFFRSKKEINKLKALDNVSFQIIEGESFGLVGESGSGKSTIAKIITSLIKPTSGEVFFEDLSLHNPKNIKIKNKYRGQIQMIFQDPYSSLNPRFKVKEIIAEPIKFFQKGIGNNAIQKNINDLIDIVGMSRQSLERYPHEFSGGQRQRISIARALATRPRLLICDEPTSALDVSIQAQILNLLKDLQEELNLTILFISHDLPVVRQMCDRIAVLRNGNLCEVEKTENLFNNPKHNYTKELLRLMPKIESIYS